MVKAGSLWQEFKSFAFKGNMLDLAVAVVIGGAFGKIISSLVADVIMPAISYIMPEKMAYTDWYLGSEAKKIFIGKFLGEVVNFLIVALAVFIAIVKVVGAMMKKATPPPAPSEPTNKECPLCLSMIPLKAKKCSHCTADLPATA